MIDPLHVYAAGLRAPRDETRVRLADGSITPLRIERFLGSADQTDELLLKRLVGPVLDVGCGPGRHLHALARQGVFGLGVDLSATAVGLARDRGVQAIVGSIFDEVPAAGTWRSALLLDGNIGIGGAPTRLLTRIGRLLADDGEVLVELDPPGSATTVTLARLETSRGTSSWFRWARVSTAGVGPIAREAGFEVVRSWSLGDRCFARLAR